LAAEHAAGALAPAICLAAQVANALHVSPHHLPRFAVFSQEPLAARDLAGGACVATRRCIRRLVISSIGIGIRRRKPTRQKNAEREGHCQR